MSGHALGAGSFWLWALTLQSLLFSTFRRKSVGYLKPLTDYLLPRISALRLLEVSEKILEVLGLLRTSWSLF